MALDADPLERHITGRTVMVTVAAASMGFVLPFANFILDTMFTLFRRLIRRVTSIELLVVVASCAAAAACIPAGPAEPQNRDVHGNHRTPAEPGQT